jgi:hypothetical protein
MKESCSGVGCTHVYTNGKTHVFLKQWFLNHSFESKALLGSQGLFQIQANLAGTFELPVFMTLTQSWCRVISLQGGETSNNLSLSISSNSLCLQVKKKMRQEKKKVYLFASR